MVSVEILSYLCFYDVPTIILLMEDGFCRRQNSEGGVPVIDRSYGQLSEFLRSIQSSWSELVPAICSSVGC